MNFVVFDIALVFLFIFTNSFFVAAEYSLLRLRAGQLDDLTQKGNYIAILTKRIISKISIYLSAIQLGITLSSLLLGWLGANVLSELLLVVFKYYNIQLDSNYSLYIALPISFLLIAILHIVIGELLPKAIAINHHKRVALSVSIVLQIFYYMFFPIIWLLDTTSRLLMKALGMQQIGITDISRSSREIREIIEESTKSGLIDTTEQELIDNIFEFSDTPIKQIMVPRTKISAIDINSSIDNIIAYFIEEGYSRMPVYQNDMDNIIGEIYGKDLLNLLANKNLIILDDIIRPAFFVQEDDKIHLLLKTMQKKHAHLAVVLNEFGGVSGIVTMGDIIEEIVGEIQDEYDEEVPLASETASNEFVLDALITIDVANEFLPIPLTESDDYETLSGLITNRIGRIPTIQESFSIDNYKLTILEATERRIEEVKLELIKTINNEAENND